MLYSFHPVYVFLVSSGVFVSLFYVTTHWNGQRFVFMIVVLQPTMITKAQEQKAVRLSTAAFKSQSGLSYLLIYSHSNNLKTDFKMKTFLFIRDLILFVR